MSNISPITQKLCLIYFCDDCQDCPIMVQCEKPVQPLTILNIKKHADQLNQAAYAELGLSL